MEIKRRSLSGTDKPPEVAPDRQPATPYGDDIVNENATAAPGDIVPYIPKRRVYGDLRVDAMSDTSSVDTLIHDRHSSPGGRRTSGDTLSGPDGRVLLHDAMRRTAGGDPDYHFHGWISEQVLHNYLNKVIEMAYLCADTSAYGWGAPDDEIDKALSMVHDVGAKFVKGLVGFWDDYSPMRLNAYCNKLRKFIDAVHAFDPDVICEAFVAENVSTNVNSIPFPIRQFFPGEDIFTVFEIEPEHSIYFVYDDMNVRHSGYNTYPDITKVETQMLYFYLATRFIDSGCEAIYFSDWWNVTWLDSGYKATYSLFEKIRRYGKTKNRHLVLLSAHGPYVSIAPAYYFDDRSIPYVWQKQLLFDFHLSGTFYIRPDGYPCLGGSRSGIPFGNCTFPLIIEHGSGGVLNHKFGGRHPQGWLCTNNPYILGFDAGPGFDLDAYGCSYPPSYINLYYGGLADTSWFVANKNEYRDLILKYNHYRIKCLDRHTYFQYPGRMYYTLGYSKLFYGTYDTGRQQPTIKNIFNDVYAGAYKWFHHDFTRENVVNFVNDVYSSLIFVGNDKMYYINSDGYIHGFIRSGDYGNGSWIALSLGPEAMGFPQVKAKSDLVASPDGTSLLYIGVDGFIYGFNIVSPWVYTYINYQSSHTTLMIHLPLAGFMRDPMIAQNIRAISSLIYTSDGIYYIGEWLGDGSKRVHGFQYNAGGWHTVSPSYAATAFTTHPVPISGQQQAARALTIDDGPVSKRIFYVGTDDLLYYFTIHDIWTYEYAECSRNYQLRALESKIQGNLAVHYYPATGTTFIYFIYKNRLGHFAGCVKQRPGSDWILVYEMWDGIDDYFSHIHSDSSGNISVSPDGSTIAYFGSRLSSKIVYFKYVDGHRFSYHLMPPVVYDRGLNSLQFVDDACLFYISSAAGSINYFKFEEDYCTNPALTDWPVR